MIALNFLRLNRYKVFASIVAILSLYIFLPIDDIEENFGLASGRMAFIQNNGRLARFPTFGVGLWISHHPSFFTDIYRVHLRARPDIIADWLERSPGVNEGSSEKLSNGTLRYHLKTSGIAGHLDVSPDGREVGIEIGTSWDGLSQAPLVPSGQGTLD